MDIRLFFLTSLYIVWFSLVGIPSGFLALFWGFTIPAITYLFCMWLSIDPRQSVFNKNIILYIFWLIKEICLSSVTVTKIAWRRHLRINPVLDALRSQQDTTAGLVLYANSITLTPGTVTINTQGSNLLVHALDISIMEDLKTGKMDTKVKTTISDSFHQRNVR